MYRGEPVFFLSGIGCGQMTVLDAHIAHHKHVQSRYVGHFIYELVYAMGWDVAL